MTQQDFARMTAVIDEWLNECVPLSESFRLWDTAESEAFQDAAADLFEALPVPEGE